MFDSLRQWCDSALTNHRKLSVVVVISLISVGFLYHSSKSRKRTTSGRDRKLSSSRRHPTGTKSPVSESTSNMNHPADEHNPSDILNSKIVRDEILRKWMDAWVSGGSYPCLQLTIIKNNDEVFYHEVGYANVDTKQNIARDTIFRIYSMTKPITAFAVLILIDRGLLRLEDEITTYIPAFKNQRVLVGGTFENPILEDLQRPVTIHHLLTHTSGITYGIFGNHLHDMLLRDKITPDDCRTWFMNLSSEQLCERIASAPLSFQPGSAFLYGLSSDVLGRIIEVVSQKSLRDFYLEEIFTPLEMFDTDFFVQERNLHRVAECYEVIPGNGYTKSLNPERRRNDPLTLFSAGGNLVSTIDDYTKFAKFLLRKCTLTNGKQLLSDSLYSMMISNQLPDGKDLVQLSIDNTFSESIGEGIGYGYGVSVVIQPEKCKGGHLSSIGEYGWGGVASTWFVIDPVKHTAVIMMANLIPSSAYPIRNQLRSLYHYVADN